MNNFFVRFCLFFATIFGFIFLLVWAYLSIVAPANAAEPLAQVEAQAKTVVFDSAHVRVSTPYGGSHDFKVEVATSFAQLRQGLMNRTELAPNRGMLFKYNPPRTVGMWMKNTLIPLDMLFADRLGRVVFIAENTVPMSEDIIQAPGRTAYVLELSAGTVKRLSIALGHRLTF
ncbi:MAG: DUF192 domain-containing protein [Magnetovibrio sp.]|nr:DUF192 domain-containing protein [Magnetovibrio sp.]